MFRVSSSSNGNFTVNILIFFLQFVPLICYYKTSYTCNVHLVFLQFVFLVQQDEVFRFDKTK